MCRYLGPTCFVFLSHPPSQCIRNGERRELFSFWEVQFQPPCPQFFSSDNTTPPYAIPQPPPLSHAFSTCGGGGKYLPRKTATKNKAEDVGRKRDKRKRQQNPKIGTLSSFSKKRAEEIAKSSFECRFPYRKKEFLRPLESLDGNSSKTFFFIVSFSHISTGREKKKIPF